MRRIHHVGTVPATPLEGESDSIAALRTVLDYTGAHITTAPAEGADRADWAVPILLRRLAHPDMRVLKRLTYDDSPTLWKLASIMHPRAGRRPTRSMLGLGYFDYAHSIWPTFQDLIIGLPQVRLQVGIPGPADLAAFSWGPWTPRFYRDEVAGALVEVQQIYELTAGAVVFQLELPVETVLVAKAPRRQQARLVDSLVRRLLDFIEQAPMGCTWIVHWCVGDANGKPLVHLPDAGPLVELSNALCAGWPLLGTQILDALHLPLGNSVDPAPVTRPYYAPLADLVVPESVHVSAGLSHYAGHVEDQVDALASAEYAFGREMGVSSSCGWGRRPEAIEVGMERLLALADS